MERRVPPAQRAWHGYTDAMLQNIVRGGGPDSASARSELGLRELEEAEEAQEDRERQRET